MEVQYGGPLAPFVQLQTFSQFAYFQWQTESVAFRTPGLQGNDVQLTFRFTVSVEYGANVEIGAVSLQAAGSSSGDPLIIGFQQQRFLVRGEEGRVFNLLSMPGLLVNSLYTRLNSGDAMSHEEMKRVRREHEQSDSPHPAQRLQARPCQTRCLLCRRPSVSAMPACTSLSSGCSCAALVSTSQPGRSDWDLLT